jgi:hypothetical protein
LNAAAPGVVRIVIETPRAKPNRRLVHIEAEFPATAGSIVRQSKDLVWDLNAESNARTVDDHK